MHSSYLYVLNAVVFKHVKREVRNLSDELRAHFSEMFTHSSTIHPPICNCNYPAHAVFFINSLWTLRRRSDLRKNLLSFERRDHPPETSRLADEANLILNHCSRSKFFNLATIIKSRIRDK